MVTKMSHEGSYSQHERRVGVVTLYGISEESDHIREEVAEWLIKLGEKLRADRCLYSTQFRARFFVVDNNVTTEEQGIISEIV